MIRLTNILFESRIAPKEKSDIPFIEFPFTEKTYIEADISFLKKYIEDNAFPTLEPIYSKGVSKQDAYKSTSYEDILYSYDSEVISYKSYIDNITDNRFNDYIKTKEEKAFILDTNDIYELRDFVNKKAKELSQENPSDFEFYQEEILDIIDKVKEKLPLFTKLLFILKDKHYTLDNTADDLSVFIERIGKELHYHAIGKQNGVFNKNKKIVLRIK